VTGSRPASGPSFLVDRRPAERFEGSHCFVTIDAETDVIETGIRVISELRQEVEAREKIRIPLVWFVRFQRSWGEYVENDSAAAFAGPVTEGYDGFAMARDQLLELLRRGDEVGWHYHAYNYVHRDDLSHATRLEILRADLAACARDLRQAHPEFPVRSLRFGWFFVPDYAIYDELSGLGIVRDASIDPGRGDGPVGPFSARHLRPLVTAPTRIDGLTLFPFSKTVLMHDWTVVAHDFGWSRLEKAEAADKRRRFVNTLAAIAARLKQADGEFLTYETAPASMLEGPAGE
jgi:hypothetical protein